MNERESTIEDGPNGAATGRALSRSAAAAASILVVDALAAGDLAGALGLSSSIPGECH